MTVDIIREITHSRAMTKPKTSEKSKKANDSASKNKGGGVTKLLKEAVEKVVAATKPSMPAKDPAIKTAGKRGSKAKDAGATEAAAPDSAVLSKAAVTPSAALGEGAVEVDDGEVVLTDAEGRRYCRATDCDQIGVVDGYCRYHYLFFWKKIQVRKKILADGKLERYIEELTARYTDKFIELLRKDLRTEKDFLAAVQELELDDSASSSQADEDEAKTYLEEISGVATESNSRDEDSY